MIDKEQNEMLLQLVKNELKYMRNLEPHRFEVKKEIIKLKNLKEKLENDHNFERELAAVFNKYSIDAKYGIPDLILVEYVLNFLKELKDAKSTGVPFTNVDSTI